MKKLIVLLCLGISMLAFNSCKKKVYGCTDPEAINYDPEANQDVGCVFTEDLYYVQYDTAVQPDWWGSGSGPWIRYDISNNSINQSIIDEGIIDVYVKRHDAVTWFELPATVPWGHNSGCEELYYQAISYPGMLRLLVHSTQCGDPGLTLPEIDVKTVVWK